jgi:hypothetical protein
MTTMIKDSVQPSAVANHVPWMVGCVRTGKLTFPHPLTLRDINADAAFAESMFERMGIRTGATVLFTSGSSEYGQFWPYEQALDSMGACVAVAENLVFDAGRSEMFMRRLNVDLAFGIGEEILDGMQMMELDPATAFGLAGKICARTGAADRLDQLGFKPWRLVDFGPTFGFVSPDGESFYDRNEWLIEAPEDEVLISARAARGNPFIRFPTGLLATIDDDGGFRLS